MTQYLMLSGAIFGLGLLLIRLGFIGHRILGTKRTASSTAGSRAVAMSMGATAIFLLTTGWVASAVAVGATTFLLVVSASRRHELRGQEEVAEAMALWTEQLRDTLSAAHGLQQTLVATSQHAPERIRPAVLRLVAKLPYAPAGQSLREFADDVDDPSADFVVAALISATEHEARDVGALLGHLAHCSREEARMHQRVWVGRARTRTAVRIISGTVIGFVGLLFLMNRSYLQPYGSVAGQAVLSLIIGIFGVALLMLQAGSRVQVPERFIGVEK